jgi:hypothetical protein
MISFRYVSHISVINIYNNPDHEMGKGIEENILNFFPNISGHEKV